MASTPALVLGGGVNGLGVARSLAHAGVSTYLLDPDLGSPEMHTRMARALKIDALHGEALIDQLVHLGTTRFSGERPVLLLTQEESVKTISQARERISPLYRFTLPPLQVVNTLLHKHGFQRLAERLGSPIPPLVHVRGLDDLPSLEQLRYPVVIKPGERNGEYSRRFKKAYRVQTAAAAIELVRRILPVMPDVVAQEWIDGPDSNIYFCLQYINRDGQPVAAFTGRKVRSWPPQVGGTASCVPAPEVHSQLVRLAARLFQAAGVIGMAGMEFKRAEHSRRFFMVEPTIGRTDYQAEVATLNGVNLPYAAYCIELGKPYPLPAMAKRSLAWRVRSQDSQSAAAQHQRRNEGFDSVNGVRDALWRWTDPVPFLLQNARRLRRAIHARVGKVGGVSPAVRDRS